jgi:hypothetical protein
MDFIASFSSCVVGLVLVIAGVNHLAHPRHLKVSLERHGLLPDRTVWPVSVVVVTSESVLGALMLAGAFVQRDVRFAAVAAALLFVCYAAYLVSVKRISPGVLCGCGGPEAEAGAVAISRALACAGLSLLAAMFGPRALAPANAALVLEAALATSLLLLVLPAAISPPGLGDRS